MENYISDLYLSKLFSVVVSSQHSSLFMAVPDEFSFSTLEYWVPRTLVSVAVVGRDDVLGHGGLVYHCHNGHTQTRTQRKRTRDAEGSHDVKH